MKQGAGSQVDRLRKAFKRMKQATEKRMRKTSKAKGVKAGRKESLFYSRKLYRFEGSLGGTPTVSMRILKTAQEKRSKSKRKEADARESTSA